MLNPSPQLELAKSAATQAGIVLRDYFQKKTEGQVKLTEAGPQGLVTAADLESERVIVESIRTAFPDHQVMAEEEHSTTREAEHLWIIDPLDGTNNFAHGIPHFAISIAYYHHGLPKCGVIYDPSREDWFMTEAGQGSWHGKKRVEVNSHTRIDETLIGVGFYYDRGRMMENTLASMNQFFQQNVQGIRRFGTAALDLVSVGIGRFGGYFEYTLSPWDFAAGQLFVTEAGGQISDCSGNRLENKKSSLLATNGHLHEKMLEVIRPFDLHNGP